MIRQIRLRTPISLWLLAAAICSVQPDRSANVVPQERDAVRGLSSDRRPSNEVFEETVRPFLTRYCLRCHKGSRAKADVVLSGISSDLAAGHDMELWKTVLRQLVVDAMPPAKKRQPEQHEKEAVIHWINGELKKSGNDSDIYSKLASPSFGNYVNHEKLFSGEVDTEPFSPARLWRTRPNVFDNVKSSYGGDARHLRQPFLL